MNNIAVVVVNIQSLISEEDDDIRFHQLYYLDTKFIIEHFKYYTEYGIDPNFIGVKGRGIVGLICFMFAYYRQNDLKKLENLMNLPQ